MDREAYSLEKGRPRPAYKPRDIHCSSCGAALTVKDEHAELVICDYCGSHLQVTAAEQKVLVKGPAAKQDFPLQLGDSFRYKSHRYEIIARMAFIEDDDLSEMTRQYLLYNPRLGTCWLDEYGGHYSLSRATHVMPESDPFERKRGQVLNTHDGRQWVTEEIGQYVLHYVDGALPWIAKSGDRVAYADFAEKSGTGEQYQVQRTENEIEFSFGQSLNIELVRRATGRPELGKTGVLKDRVDAAVKRRFYMTVIMAAIIAMVINLVLLVYTFSTGKQVFRQRFTADQLNGEVLSEPFRVSSDIIKIISDAQPRLNNEWMAMDVAVVGDQEDVLHVYDADISYYHGYEGGEKWSEGSQSQSTFIQVSQPGVYRLLLHAVSAHGSVNLSNKTSHGVIVRVEDGARMPHFFIGAAVLSVLILVLSIWSYSKWKMGDGDDEDE